MRIRRRLALLGAAVTAAAMIIFGALVGSLGAAAAPGDQEEQLEILAVETLAALEGTDPASLAGQPPPLVLVDPGESVDPYIAVYEADGTPIYATARIDGEVPRLPAAVAVEALDTGSSRATATAASDIEVRLYALAWSSSGTEAVLVAGQSTAFVEEQLAGLGAAIWVAGILALIVATLVGWLVSGRALRPLRDLAATTDEIGRTGDLSRRLADVKADDEVGALTRSFNAMLDRVESAQGQLEGALDSQRRFVADASHELRSPLTTIRSNAGFLRDRPDAAIEDRAEAVSDIAAEADRMSRLVDDLLTLAAEDAGRRGRRMPVDVGEIVEGLARRADDQLPQPVVMDVERRLMVLGDGPALTRLVWTLIENAALHGGAAVKVAVRRDDGDARIEVRDDGPGFAEGDLDRVFERFYRADPARSPAGSGLGLAIARGVVAEHGGSIDASNAAEGGAVLTVRLPLAP